jgi:AAA+ ATPase superfamily predicted ATPase
VVADRGASDPGDQADPLGLYRYRRQHQFGEALASYLDEPTPFRFAGWDEPITRLMRLATNGPKPVVIDEFPFLAKATPALPSLIQRALEPSAQRRNTPVRQLLCGSALSFMGKLLAGSAPLRGRAGLELLVPIAEPLLIFYHAIMRPAWGDLERPGRATQVWRRSQHAFHHNVVGPHLEEICRQWSRWHAGPETYGGAYPRPRRHRNSLRPGSAEDRTSGRSRLRP